MKFAKLSCVIAAIALFALACGETNTTNNQNVNSTRPSPAANSNSTANAANTSTAPTDELAGARTTYSQTCSACHGEGGDGGNVTIEGKKLKVPSLKQGHALNHTDEQLAKTITNGDDGMPAFKDRLKPEQINAMVRFVRREFQGGASKATETAPAAKD